MADNFNVRDQESLSQESRSYAQRIECSRCHKPIPVVPVLCQECQISGNQRLEDDLETEDLNASFQQAGQEGEGLQYRRRCDKSTAVAEGPPAVPERRRAVPERPPALPEHERPPPLLEHEQSPPLLEHERPPPLPPKLKRRPPPSIRPQHTTDNIEPPSECQSRQSQLRHWFEKYVDFKQRDEASPTDSDLFEPVSDPSLPRSEPVAIPRVRRPDDLQIPSASTSTDESRLSLSPYALMIAAGASPTVLLAYLRQCHPDDPHLINAPLPPVDPNSGMFDMSPPRQNDTN